MTTDDASLLTPLPLLTGITHLPVTLIAMEAPASQAVARQPSVVTQSWR